MPGQVTLASVCGPIPQLHRVPGPTEHSPGVLCSFRPGGAYLDVAQEPERDLKQGYPPGREQRIQDDVHLAARLARNEAQ